MSGNALFVVVGKSHPDMIYNAEFGGDTFTTECTPSIQASSFAVDTFDQIAFVPGHIEYKEPPANMVRLSWLAFIIVVGESHPDSICNAKFIESIFVDRSESNPQRLIC